MSGRISYLFDKNCSDIFFSLQELTMKVMAILVLVALATVSLADPLARERRFLPVVNDVTECTGDEVPVSCL